MVGSLEELAMAVRAAADVRYYTAFDYADHMCVPGSAFAPEERLRSECHGYATRLHPREKTLLTTRSLLVGVRFTIIRIKGFLSVSHSQ